MDSQQKQSMLNNGLIWQSKALAPEVRSVLRNTYMCLALTMIPTIVGAWVGLRFGFNLHRMLPFHPVLSALLFLALTMGVMAGVMRLRNSGWGVALLLVFTGFMGLALSGILQFALKLANGSQLITIAAVGTGAIFFAMATVATVSKRDFSYLGKFLFIGLILIVLASLANIYFQIPALMLALSFVGVLLFSAYLLYDLSRIVTQGETNYVVATLTIYLNLYNLFLSLLNLLMAFSGRSE